MNNGNRAGLRAAKLAKNSKELYRFDAVLCFFILQCAGGCHARVILSGGIFRSELRNGPKSNAERDTQCRDLRATNVLLVDPQNAVSVLTFKNQQFVADF